MAAAVRADKALRGALELALVAAGEALVDRGVGPEVGDLVIGVVPDILQRLKVPAHVGELGIADETAR